MAPGRSPSRLRSKTSDFSDLIRGNPRQHSTDALVPPVPPIPPSEAITPTKSRRTLAGLLGRKRKSGGFALESGSHSQKEDEDYPAVPDALLHSRIPAPSSSGGVTPSLPSSLPPLNVSPPSFGAAFPSSSTSPVTTRLSTTTNESSVSNSGLRPQASIVSETSAAKSAPLRMLRPQKSTSFDVSRPFNFTHNATASNMAILTGADGKVKAKPVITVSAPPANVGDSHVDEFNAPRTPPPPPAASRPRSAKEQARKTLNHFGFGHHAKKDDVAKKERRPSATVADGRVSTGSDAKSTSSASSPKLPLSPMLPAKMEFPIPPARGKQVAAPSRTSTQSAPRLAGAFEYSPSTTPTAKTSRAAVASDTSDGELSHASTRSAPARPIRPASLIIPNSGASRPRSNSAMTVTKIPASPASPSTGKPGVSPRLRSIRASRSPSPASPPPVAPLPSPPTSTTLPSSDAEGWSTDASTRLGGWSTDTSSRIGSLASRKSAPPRVRAHTIMGSLSKAPAGSSGAGEATDRSRARHGRAAAAVPPVGAEQPRTGPNDTAAGRVAHLGVLHDDGGSTLTLSRPSSERSRGSQETATPTPTTPAKEDVLNHSLRAAHDTYIRILQEKHAVEKADLLKRIDRLEREARKRDKEIKGLRLIILSSSNRSGEHAAVGAISSDEYLALGRLRSGSKSSEASHDNASHARTRSRSSGTNLNSPEEGTDDGLLELQNEVSEFIAPYCTPRMEPAQGERSGSPSSMSSLRRYNTMREGFPPPQRVTKRASSPVLLAPGGLGFDIPSLPGSESDVSGGESSVPSLTASNTASSTPSSTLSAIPELAYDADLPRHEADERRTSRALKRLSSPSIVQAASSYATNLKLGMSPSIGQVLDRTRAEREAGMDDAMRKLRAFGREQ